MSRHEKETQRVVYQTQKKRYVRGPVTYVNYWMWKALYPSYSYDEAIPIALPWFRYHFGKDDISRLNRTYLKCTRSSLLPFLFRLVLWPFLTVLRILREMKHHALDVSRHYKVGVVKQLTGQLKLMVLYNIGPITYYGCHLFKHRDRYEQYCRETKVFQLLDQIRPPHERDPVDDKLQFFQRLQNWGLPTPKIFAAGCSGRWTHLLGSEDSLPPLIDIVLKPIHLARGYGIEIWRYQKEQNCWERAGIKLNREALLNYCLSKKIPYLMQERLVNHPSLESISPGALANARLVTYKRSDTEVFLFHSFFRMSVSNMSVSNVGQGGISSLIHLNTGTLLAAVSEESMVEMESHPDADTTIIGMSLPSWDKACQLVKDAHKNFELPFIGWDVVFTPDGPYLLEGNSGWGIDERFPILGSFATFYMEILDKKAVVPSFPVQMEVVNAD